jgi:chromosome segregation ATPase
VSQPPRHAEPADTIRRCTLTLLVETYEAARALIAEQGWPEDEGLRIIFAHGLAFLRAERELARLHHAGGDLAREVERLIGLVMQLEGQYAVMTFRVFELQQENQTLRLNVAGLRGENELAHARLARYRADEERLRDALARLTAENEQLRLALATMPAETTGQPAAPIANACLIGRLLARLRSR